MIQHVSGVRLSCGDDNIAMNAFAVPFQDVLIEDSYFGWGHGVSIGSMTQAGLHNITVRNVVMNGTGGGIHIKSYIGGGGSVSYRAENITLHGVEEPIKLEQHYGGAKPPCMPHCNTSRRPFFNVSITGMHADGIPKADLGPFLNGTTDPGALILTVTNSSFKTASGDPVEWKCTNADVTVRGVDPPPKPGSCTHITRGRTDDISALAFLPPVKVGQSNYSHFWMPSSVFKGIDGHLILSIDMAGDGKPCPPPGHPQNCSALYRSSNSGASWVPIYGNIPGMALPIPQAGQPGKTRTYNFDSKAGASPGSYEVFSAMWQDTAGAVERVSAESVMVPFSGKSTSNLLLVVTLGAILTDCLWVQAFHRSPGPQQCRGMSCG